MIRRKLKLLFACILTVVCASYAVRAVKASIASSLYLKTRYGFFAETERAGEPMTDPVKVAYNAERAKSLFPENYHFFSYAAGLSLAAARDAETEDDYLKYIKKALYYSKYALDLNPYDETSRRHYTETLAEEGRIAEAIEYWRANVIEREFWVTINQETFARLLLRSGDPAHKREAAQMLPLVRDPNLRSRITALQRSLK